MKDETASYKKWARRLGRLLSAFPDEELSDDLLLVLIVALSRAEEEGKNFQKSMDKLIADHNKLTGENH